MNDLDLNLKIEKLRTKMILSGMSNGLASSKTIKLSQELDTLLNLKLNGVKLFLFKGRAM